MAKQNRPGLGGAAGSGGQRLRFLKLSPRSVRVKADIIWNDVGKTNDTFACGRFGRFSARE